MLKFKMPKIPFLCQHKWVKVDEARIWDIPEGKRPIHVKWILQCEKCGNIKTKSIV